MKAAEPWISSCWTRRHASLLVAGLLAVAALAAYRNTFPAPFELDDSGSITENPTIRRLWPPWGALVPPGGGETVSGRPLMNFSLAANYAVSGEAVWSYHVLNLVIHWLAACVLFGVARRTLRLWRANVGRGRRTPPIPNSAAWLLSRPAAARYGDAALQADATWVALAVALLWLLHPLQTEAVTYVSQRTESLAGLFYLLTLYAFIRAGEGTTGPRTTDHETGDRKSPVVGGRWSCGPRCWSVLAVAACLLGVATKEILATAPLLVFLYDRTFVAGTFREAWRRRRTLHLSLAATWVPLGLLVAGTGWNRGGTAGFDVGVAPWAYWLTQFGAITHYLRLTLWPHPLVFEYGPFWVGWWQAAPHALVVLILVAATWVALWRRPAAGFLGAWFFTILAPTSLVPGTNQMIVEHRMYLPLAAVVALAVTGLHAALGRRSLLLWPMAAMVLGWLTFRRNATYASDLSLWSDTVAKAPGNPRAHYSLGIAWSERGDYARAVGEDEAALRFDTTRAAAEKEHVMRNKLGYDLAMLGRWPEAVAQYEQALRLQPDYAVAHLNLARALVRLGRYPEAIHHFESALRLHPGDAQVEAECSDALLHEGRVGEAVTHCRAAVRLAPSWAPGFNNLAYALLLTGHVEEAVADYRAAVRLDPHYAAALVGLGYALVQAGRPGEAVAPCSEAARLQPDFADAHNTLGIAYAQTGRPADAIASFERALRLNPGAADVRNNLGNALAAAGRREEALAQYREAVRLNPDYAPAQRNLGEELRRAGRLAEAAEHLTAAARLEAAEGNPPSGK